MIATVFQVPGRVNLVLPGSLMPFKKEISNIFTLEKENFLCKKRFANVFADIEIQPFFQNRANLKKKIGC